MQNRARMAEPAFQTLMTTAVSVWMIFLVKTANFAVLQQFQP